MIEDLKSYEPNFIEFVLPEHNYPVVLFEGAEDMEIVRKYLTDRFICLNETSQRADRFMDSFEIKIIRETYAHLLENDEPEKKEELDSLIAEYKQKVGEAKDRLKAIQTQIRDYVYQIKDGTKKYELPKLDTFKMAVDGNYLYYSWINDQFRLCKIQSIPEWDKRDLFAQQEKNHKALKEIFGIDYENGKTTIEKGETIEISEDIEE